MKKLRCLLLPAAICCFASSCQKDTEPFPCGSPIEFSANLTVHSTKSGAESLRNSFSVRAFLSSDGTTEYFQPTSYKWNGSTLAFSSEIVRHWPESGNLDFFAVTPASYTDNASEVRNLEAASEITVTKLDGNTDFALTKKVDAENGYPATLYFDHKLARLSFTAKGFDSAKKYVIESISVKLNSSGKYSYGTPGSWSECGEAYTYEILAASDTLKTGQTTSRAVGRKLYVIPVQAEKVTLKVSYKVFDGETLIADYTGADAREMSITTKDIWGVNKSLVYNITLEYETKGGGTGCSATVTETDF